MGFKKGHKTWNKGLTKETDERVKKIGEKISKSKKGMESSFKGKHHTKETKKRLSEKQKTRIGVKSPNYGRQFSEEHKKKLSESHKGQIPWSKGKKMSEEFCRVNRETHLGKKHTKETKEKMSRIQKKVQNRPEIKRKKSKTLKGKPLSETHKQSIKEALNRPEIKNKISETSKKWFEIVENKERHKKIMEEKSGENHHNWNPNRAEVYAPYGENFYNQNIRDRKWDLQNSRDMLTGTVLYPNKKTAYHHIDYDKSNDDPDNHCFVSINNHMRITGNQQNPIKSERYKKILEENTLALKNGEIPKYWSPLNKELFRQEKSKQLDLSLYI